ncbi:hypothetical protein AVDCRST_MAG84-4053 [uncultured Microcoleus sp.]|uniref:Uncharacterized protein n=1 Tax=uncultured Microcoleus sp. TaxID=259945 RepID=A0A6J4MYV5_9CYAN|nr:hypothetical protein AVDCRST_MAG84-4053 [uncultured Microcoleus sp.]
MSPGRTPASETGFFCRGLIHCCPQSGKKPDFLRSNAPPT